MVPTTHVSSQFIASHEFDRKRNWYRYR